MRRPRHRPRSSARLSFSLLSALALIALCCVPAFAQAECTDSSCKQYEVEIPTAGGNESKPKHKTEGQGEAPAEASNAPTGKQHESQPSENDSEEEKGTATPAGNGGNGNNGGNGPSGQGGSPGGNGSNQASTGLDDEKSLGGTTQGQTASHSSGDSSPLVPILIAIAVLAAISIGAVIYRQRRQGGGSGSPVSPKAG